MSSHTETPHLAAARNGDQQQFSELVEPYRRELRAYCYRMLGSLQDAEDVVQETMLRAWRRLDSFEGRASFRAWLYKIATNASLDALDRAKRRTLPNTLSAPAESSATPLAPINDPIWLDPFPDDWLDETTISPEAHFTRQESVTLAFLTALQVLPPRQRAVVVLCDVLDWRTNEAASLLDMTDSAVSSALHRARTTLSSQYEAAPTADSLTAGTQNLLARYLRVWEEADVQGLVSLLKEDATFTMPPSSAWFLGQRSIGEFFGTIIFAEGVRYRLLPIHVSGQPGFAAYAFDAQSGTYHAHALHVLTIDNGRVAALTGFLTPQLFGYFGLPNDLS